MKNQDIIAERLAEIADKNGGIVTPDAVVLDAKSKDSPLHSLFEWDIKKAAHKHWVETARNIIASVEVVIKREHITVRTPIYIRDPSAKARDQGYRAVSELRQDHDAARFALVNEFQRVADLLRRASHLAVAMQLDGEVDELVNRVVGLRNRLQDDPPSASVN